MKNYRNYFAGALLLIAISIISTGCPVGMDYPLGQPGKEKIDARLLGTWQVLDGPAEILKVRIEKANEYTYRVQVLESSEEYMMDGTAFNSWVTELDGKTFLYSQPSDTEDTDYYVYHYDFEANNQLVIHDVSLLVGGTDAVTSAEAFRKEVSASLKMPDCLAAEIKYRKE